MIKDYSAEVKELIKKNKTKGFEYGKPVDYLCFRNKAKKEDFESDLINCKDLKLAIKQEREGEIRYILYFVYSSRRGRAYAIVCREKIRIITIWPLGRRTLKKYRKEKFKK